MTTKNERIPVDISRMGFAESDRMDVPLYRNKELNEKVFIISEILKIERQLEQLGTEFYAEIGKYMDENGYECTIEGISKLAEDMSLASNFLDVTSNLLQDVVEKYDRIGGKQ